MSRVNPYRPARPGPWRLRAVVCAWLAVAVLGGCRQWPDQPGPMPFEGAGDHVAGSTDWQDVYRIESPDVLRLKLLGGEAPGLEGTYPVLPDGAIDLKQHGKVYVAGKSLPTATRAVEHHLSRALDGPKVSLTVAEHNSRYYYCVVQDQGRDRVTRVPLGESDTVLDAISRIGGLASRSPADIWIRRPARGDIDQQILPVDWEAITRDADMTTNYQLMPGDVIYVAEDEPCCGGTSFTCPLPEPGWKRVSGRIAAGIRNMQSVCLK